MKQGKWLLCATMSGLLAASAAWAQGGAPAGAQTKPAKAAGELRGEYAILAAEVQLTDDQKSKVEARLKAYNEALADWDKENGEKLKAAKASDANAAKVLAQAREKLATDRDADIQAMLTAQQQLKWEGFKLYRGEMQALRRANLTDDQKPKIRALCDAAAPEISNLKDEKALKDAKGKLRQNCLDVLTPEQKDAMKKGAETKPAAK